MQEYGAFYCIFCINHQDNTALQWLKPEVNLNFIKKKKAKKKKQTASFEKWRVRLGFCMF